MTTERMKKKKKQQSSLMVESQSKVGEELGRIYQKNV